MQRRGLRTESIRPLFQNQSVWLKGSAGDETELAAEVITLHPAAIVNVCAEYSSTV